MLKRITTSPLTFKMKLSEDVLDRIRKAFEGLHVGFGSVVERRVMSHPMSEKTVSETPVGYFHPTTFEQYDTLEEFVEAMAETLINFERYQKAYAKEKQAVTEALEKLARDYLLSEEELITSKQILKGKTKSIQVQFRTSAKYDKARGKPHPLEDIISRHPEAASLVRVTLAEAGSKIQTMIDNYVKYPEHYSAKEMQLVKELKDVRRVEQTTSVIKVVGEGVDEVPDEED